MQDREEGLHPYIPELGANPLAFINYNQTSKYLAAKRLKVIVCYGRQTPKKPFLVFVFNLAARLNQKVTRMVKDGED